MLSSFFGDSPAPQSKYTSSDNDDISSKDSLHAIYDRLHEELGADILQLNEALEQEVKDRHAALAGLRSEMLEAIDKMRRDGRIPATPVAAATPTSLPQLGQMQAAMENSRTSFDAARVKVETGLDSLMLFKDRTEGRIHEIEGMIKRVEAQQVQVRSADGGAGTIVASGPPSHSAHSNLDIEAWKIGLKKFKGQLRLQHVQSGLFTLLAFDIAPDERPHCIEELERTEQALKEMLGAGSRTQDLKTNTNTTLV